MRRLLSNRSSLVKENTFVACQTKNSFFRGYSEQATTSLRKKRIENLLSPLNPKKLEVVDYGTEGEANSVSIKIVSDEFEGKGTLQQHRLVQNLLREEMKGIHSITISTISTSEYEK